MTNYSVFKTASKKQKEIFISCCKKVIKDNNCRDFECDDCPMRFYKNFVNKTDCTNIIRSCNDIDDIGNFASYKEMKINKKVVWFEKCLKYLTNNNQLEFEF